MAFRRKVKDDLLDMEQDTGKARIYLKKFAIPIVFVVIIAIFLLVRLVMGANKGSLNYYDTLAGLFTNELGTFKYVFEVQTGEKGSLITEKTVVDVSMDELNSAETVEDENTADEDESDTQKTDNTVKDDDQRNEFQDWNKYAEVKGGDWEYPTYKLILEGVTTSLDPLQTDVVVTLATEGYNDIFTEIVCFDDNYYIDIESMYNWLRSSGDSYLIGVGKKLPNGSKWLVVPASEFKFASRYAEDGEKEFSEVTGLRTLYERFLIGLCGVRDAVKNGVGTAGMVSHSDTATLNVSGDAALPFLYTLKDIVVRGGDFYESLVNAGVSKNLYTEEQAEQARREEDNVLSALSDLASYLNIVDFKSVGLKVGGSCRSYINGRGNDTLEAILGLNFSSDTTDYIVQFSGIRSGDSKEIRLPQGSQTKEQDICYKEVVGNVIDYLNFTSIKTEAKLEVNPETISDEIIGRFVELVNDTGTAGYYVTKNNVFDFIEKYANYEETEDSTKEDIMNHLMVTDLADAMSRIVGGVVVERVIEKGEDVEQYPAIHFETEDGLAFDAVYDMEESDAQIIKLNVEVTNKSKKAVKVDARDFSLRTLLNSIYPANNEVTIRNYDNTFDMDTLTGVVKVPSHGWATFPIYCVLSDDGGHMNLFYGDLDFGTVVEY